MGKNIFEGAKFGDKFVTRDGRKVVYIHRNPEINCYACAIEGETELYHYDYSGMCIRGIEFYNENDHIPFDIVSRYQEPIDDYELDKFKDQCMNKYRWYEYDMRSFLEGIEIGYRKAMEDKI